MSDDLIKLLSDIKSKREKDGYKVICKTNNKYTIEEIVKKIIVSHT